MEIDILLMFYDENTTHNVAPTFDSPIFFWNSSNYAPSLGSFCFLLEQCDLDLREDVVRSHSMDPSLASSNPISVTKQIR